MAEERQEELEGYLQIALEVARKAGKVAREAAHLDKKVETKSSTADLVTETDKKVEELIFSQLKHHFPTHCFIGEECTADGGQYPELTDEPTWIVDPIDGTTNFVHGFPFSAVSIGLAINKTPVVGVVYNFVLDQMFAAREGGGATMNGSPIHVSNCTEPTKALILTETAGSSRLERLLRSKFDVTFELTKAPNLVQGFRCVGSAALALCMVACGSADGYYENDLHCWDIAGGDMIVREAGGVTMFPTGEPLDIMRKAVLSAGTQELAQKLVPFTQQLQFPDSRQ